MSICVLLSELCHLPMNYLLLNKKVNLCNICIMPNQVFVEGSYNILLKAMGFIKFIVL